MMRFVLVAAIGLWVGVAHAGDHPQFRDLPYSLSLEAGFERMGFDRELFHATKGPLGQLAIREGFGVQLREMHAPSVMKTAKRRGINGKQKLILVAEQAYYEGTLGKITSAAEKRRAVIKADGKLGNQNAHYELDAVKLLGRALSVTKTSVATDNETAKASYTLRLGKRTLRLGSTLGKALHRSAAFFARKPVLPGPRRTK